jgi:hypothetical protein
MYRLDYFTFSNLGIDPAGVDPTTVRVFSGTNLPLREPYDVPPPEFMTECALLALDDDPVPDAIFDVNDRFLFQALGPHGWAGRYDPARSRTEWVENPYTDSTYCWVTWGGSFSSPPRRMAQRTVAPGGGPHATTAPRRVHLEENNVESFDYPDEDGWQWENLFGRGGNRLYPIRLDDVAASGDGAIRARVLSNGEISLASGIRDVELKVQGQIVADSVWNHQNTRARIDLTGCYDGLLVPGSNSIQVNAKKTLPNSLDRVYTTWFDVEYDATLRPVAGTHLDFFAAAVRPPEVAPSCGLAGRYGVTSFRLQGFRTSRPTADVFLFDATDQHDLVRLTGFGGAATGSFSDVTFTDTPFTAADTLNGATRWYRAVTMEGVLPLPAGEIVDLPGLREPGQGEYVVIHHPSLQEGAERLAALRGNLPGRERSTRVIDIRDIYDEFAWGMRDPIAVRDFLGSALANWIVPPFYVVLIGDAAYDTKKFLSGSPDDLVGTYTGRYRTFSTLQFSGGENLHFYPTDDYFAYLDAGDYAGQGVQPALDMAVGRYPVNDPADLDVLLDKLEAYLGYQSPGQWQNRIILTADDERTLSDLVREDYHTTQVETLARVRVPPSIDKVKIYLTEYQRNDFGKKPDAQAAFIDEFTRGALMVTYTGHGDQNTMAQEEVFVSQKIASLLNEDRYVIFSTFSCTVSRFDLLSGDGMTERILKHADGGAVTTFASGGLVYPSASASLNQSWLGNMFGTPYPINTYARSVHSIGESAMWAKILVGRNFSDFENSEKYVLLGDPALEVRYGREPIEFEAVTVDSQVVDQLLRVVRGAVLSQQGQVLDGTGPEPAFNGTAYVHVTDQENDDGYDYDAGHIDYVLEGPTAFRGRVPVVNGRFEAKFFLSEAVQTGNRARISVFALENGTGRDASGAADSLSLAPTITASQVDDGQGPRVTVRFEGYESFRSGDFLFTDRPILTVELEDESGINLGPFPQFALLAAKVDGGDQVDLSDDFSYDEGSFTRGRVRRILPVTAGEHTLEVKAFDNVGNRGVEEVRFTVVLPSAGFDIVDRYVAVYPNPFAGSTEILYRLTHDAEASLKIFTITGRRIWEDGPRAAHAGDNRFHWDGRDGNGRSLANGTYLFKVEASYTDPDTDRRRTDEYVGHVVRMQ